MLKELRVEFILDSKKDVAIVAEGGTLTLGQAKPCIVEVPAATTARFIRLERTQPGSQLRVNEFRVIGKFE